jgi:hypothetical protein
MLRIAMVSEQISARKHNFLINFFMITEPHNHAPELSRLQEARQKHSINMKTLSEASLEYENRIKLKIEKIEYEVLEVHGIDD